MFTLGTQGQKFWMNLSSFVCASMMVLGCGGEDLNYADGNGKAEKKSMTALEVLLSRDGDEITITAGDLKMITHDDGDLTIEVADGAFMVRSDGELEVLKPIEDLDSLKENLAASSLAISNMLPELAEKPEAAAAVNYLEVSMNDDAGVLSPDELKWFGLGVLVLYSAGLAVLVTEAAIASASAEALVVAVKAEREVAAFESFYEVPLVSEWLVSLRSAVAGAKDAQLFYSNVCSSIYALSSMMLIGGMTAVGGAVAPEHQVRLGTCESDGSDCMVDGKPIFADIDALP